MGSAEAPLGDPFVLADGADSALYSLTDEACEPQSLEYIEDPYFIRLDSDATPSLDEPEAGWVVADVSHISASVGHSDLCDDDDSLLCVETEFIADNRKRRLRIFKRKMRDVRVTFQDFSKPYLIKMSSQNNYKKFLGLSGAEDGTPISPSEEATPELMGLTDEQIEKQKSEWKRELDQVEDEIATLRLVLASKIKVSSELKRKLGISVWKELTEDMNQGLKNVKESNVYHNVESCVGQITKAVTDAPVYQKTESVIKSTAEKTSSIFGGITGGITSKLGQMRNSESFRSIEEKMGSAYENVKGKVSSRSNSMHSFDESLRDSDRVTPIASPTIPENKPLQ